MKTKSILTEEFYKRLYNEIMDVTFEPEHEDDTSCEMELEFGNMFVRLTATFDVRYVDDSFDMYYSDGHYETTNLIGIDVDGVFMFDGDEEYEITDHFDEEAFWEQFKIYGYRDIKPGDEVEAKTAGLYGRVFKGTYLYTDTMKSRHIIKSSYRTVGAIFMKKTA